MPSAASASRAVTSCSCGTMMRVPLPAIWCWMPLASSLASTAEACASSTLPYSTAQVGAVTRE